MPNHQTMTVIEFLYVNEKKFFQKILFPAMGDQMFNTSKETAWLLINYFMKNGIDMGISKRDLSKIDWDDIRIFIIGAYIEWRGVRKSGPLI